MRQINQQVGFAEQAIVVAVDPHFEASAGRIIAPVHIDEAIAGVDAVLGTRTAAGVFKVQGAGIEHQRSAVADARQVDQVTVDEIGDGVDGRGRGVGARVAKAEHETIVACATGQRVGIETSRQGIRAAPTAQAVVADAADKVVTDSAPGQHVGAIATGCVDAGAGDQTAIELQGIGLSLVDGAERDRCVGRGKELVVEPQPGRAAGPENELFDTRNGGGIEVYAAEVIAGKTQLVGKSRPAINTIGSVERRTGDHDIIAIATRDGVATTSGEVKLVAKGRSVQGVRRCSSLTKQRAIGEGKLAASEAAPVNSGEQNALALVADERIRTGLRQNERSGGV